MYVLTSKLLTLFFVLYDQKNVNDILWTFYLHALWHGVALEQ